MPNLCDEANLQELVRAMQSGDDRQLARADALLARHPDDARLHFLRGSILASAGRFIEAHQALSRAVQLAPDFAIARFQLGFLQLTSGETNNALETWGRLDNLADGHYLRKFVDGLRCLIRDDFAGVIEALRAGIALNSENPPLNRDMQMIIDRCIPLAAQTAGEAPVSETSLILQQFSQKQRPN